MRQKIYRLLNLDEEHRRSARIFEFFILTLIALNVFAVVAETVGTIEIKYKTLFWDFEVFSVAVFTLEYVSRLWTCVENPRYRKSVRGRLRYSVSFFGLIDLLAILPFYAPMLIAFDLRFLRAVRLFRVFRLLKVARYSKAMNSLGDVLKAQRAELGVTVIAVLLFLLIASTIMFDVEHEAQPNTFPDIPSAMWWGVVTLTTVGYGDIYPITPLGKFLGAIIALLGIGLFALPAGIIASGLVEQVRDKKEDRFFCPHCGHKLE
ncbi:MAG: ion transporter [Bryobacteraceae bacterium]|jgi:voltage-gated potassium channel